MCCKNGFNEMDPPLCGAALISHTEVSASDEDVSELLIWYPLLEDERHQLCVGVP
jgi:hypothetical protein